MPLPLLVLALACAQPDSVSEKADSGQPVVDSTDDNGDIRTSARTLQPSYSDMNGKRSAIRNYTADGPLADIKYTGRAGITDHDDRIDDVTYAGSPTEMTITVQNVDSDAPDCQVVSSLTGGAVTYSTRSVWAVSTGGGDTGDTGHEGPHSLTMPR